MISTIPSAEFLQSHWIDFFMFASVEYGVPQGSFMGPFLFFLMYTLFRHVIQRQSVSFHFYADEMQVLLTIRSSNLCLDEP